jgi:hypothetical protein
MSAFKLILAAGVLFGCFLMTELTSAHAMDFQIIGSPQSEPIFVLAAGEILIGDDKKFEAITAGHEHVNVSLSSTGGNPVTAMLIGEMIRRHGFTTLVLKGNECYSACALAWLGARKRLMERGAIVGFHGVYQTNNGRPLQLRLAMPLLAHT